MKYSVARKSGCWSTFGGIQARVATLISRADVLAKSLPDIDVAYEWWGEALGGRRKMEDIASNRVYPLWGLRRGDLLIDFFQTFEQMHGALRRRTEGDMLLLQDLIIAIEAGQDVTNRLPKLRELVKSKGESLRPASNVTKKLRRA